MSKLFRGALFGYNKKDVSKYIEDVSEKFDSQLKAYEAEIEKLNGIIKENEEKKEALALEREKIESRKVEIEEAINSAKEEGEDIIKASKELAEQERLESQKKIAEENRKLLKIRREILNIRRNAIKTLNALNIDDENESEE